ncbi:flavoprotein [Micromonospora sp. BL1]|uniref:flavoprotein n=1 Tax=unclassified Micromonospora TaxID=2617518 RepID=UPI0018F59E17|nr:flavoprotein [Micromonospora sp. BL1]
MPQNEREPTADSAKAVPEFGGRRLLLVSSGAVAVMHLPFWLNWISTNYPDLQIQAVVTPSAQRFVSQDALTLLTGRRAHLDRWPAQTDTGALHAQWVEWADCALVYPATLNYLGRLASGLGDSPSLLALQCAATIPIVVAPSLPPGATDNPIVQGNLRRLATRPNLVVAPTQPARSATTGRRDAAGAVPVWSAIVLLERCRRALAGTGDEQVTPHRTTQPIRSA